MTDQVQQCDGAWVQQPHSSDVYGDI